LIRHELRPQPMVPLVVTGFEKRRELRARRDWYAPG
jgi:hypothetical protein